MLSHHAEGERYEAEKKRSASRVSIARRCFSIFEEFFADWVLADPRLLRDALERQKQVRVADMISKDMLDPMDSGQ